MPTRNVNLTEELDRFIVAKVKSGRYENASEVVRDAVTSRTVPLHAPTFADGRACDAVLDQLRAAPFASGAD